MDTKLALRDFIVNPDMSLSRKPSGVWNYLDPAEAAAYEGGISSSVEGLQNQVSPKQQGALNYILNQDQGYDADQLDAILRERQQRILQAVQEGRVAQTLGAQRAPASQPMVDAQTLSEMQKKNGWASQPSRNKMIPSHSRGADAKSYETRNLWEDFWRNPENIKKAKDLGIIK